MLRLSTRMTSLSSSPQPEPCRFKISRVSEKIASTTVEGGLFIAILGRKMLGSDTGEQLDVEFPSRGMIGAARSELPFEESKSDFEAGQAPLLQKVASFHGNENVGKS